MPPTGRKMALWPALVLLTIWFSLPADCQNAIALVGSGSNLPTPRYSHWTEEFNKLSPNVQVRYLSTGTMKGIDDISHSVGDFAAGEVPMSDEQLNAAKGPILQIPTVLVAIVPIYHLPGVQSGLRFSGSALADIFLGNIKTWEDRGLRKTPQLRSAPSEYCRHSLHGGKRFQLHIHRFSLEGKLQVAQRDWEDPFAVLARRHRRPSRRGHDGESEEHTRRDWLH